MQSASLNNKNEDHFIAWC